MTRPKIIVPVCVECGEECAYEECIRFEDDEYLCNACAEYLFKGIKDLGFKADTIKRIEELMSFEEPEPWEYFEEDY